MNSDTSAGNSLRELELEVEAEGASGCATASKKSPEQSRATWRDFSSTGKEGRTIAAVRRCGCGLRGRQLQVRSKIIRT